MFTKGGWCEQDISLVFTMYVLKGGHCTEMSSLYLACQQGGVAYCNLFVYKQLWLVL